MKKYYKRLLVYLAIMLIFVSPAFSQNPDSLTNSKSTVPGTFALLTDQDVLFFFPKSLNEDRNYTQGTAFVYSHERLLNSFLLFPQRFIYKKAHLEKFSSSVALGGTGFTPRIIDSVAPIVGDRPFAFLLYLQTSATLRYDNSKGQSRYHTFNINYGVLGTNIGYKFQGWAHTHIIQGRPKDPKGWNTQISKGGRPTILLEYNRFQPLVTWPKSDAITGRSVIDLGFNLGGSIGYYDRAHTGLYLRLGHLRNVNQARWNNSFGSLTGASYQMNAPKSRGKFYNNVEAFIYGRVNGTLMLRNSMLVGQHFGNNIYTLESDWTKKGLYEFEWGFVIDCEYLKQHRKSGRMKTAPQTWAFMFRTVYRSPEFDSGIFPVRWHYFGSAGILFPLGN